MRIPLLFYWKYLKKNSGPSFSSFFWGKKIRSEGFFLLGQQWKKSVFSFSGNFSLFLVFILEALRVGAPKFSPQMVPWEKSFTWRNYQLTSLSFFFQTIEISSSFLTWSFQNKCGRIFWGKNTNITLSKQNLMENSSWLFFL